MGIYKVYEHSDARTDRLRARTGTCDKVHFAPAGTVRGTRHTMTSRTRRTMTSRTHVAVAHAVARTARTCLARPCTYRDDSKSERNDRARNDVT